MGFKPIPRAQMKNQNAKSKIVESRRAGMEFEDSQKKLSVLLTRNNWKFFPDNFSEGR